LHQSRVIERDVDATRDYVEVVFRCGLVRADGRDVFEAIVHKLGIDSPGLDSDRFTGRHPMWLV
jgi:hypothetical protein